MTVSIPSWMMALAFASVASVNECLTAANTANQLQAVSQLGKQTWCPAWGILFCSDPYSNTGWNRQAADRKNDIHQDGSVVPLTHTHYISKKMRLGTDHIIQHAQLYSKLKRRASQCGTTPQALHRIASQDLVSSPRPTILSPHSHSIASWHAWVLTIRVSGLKMTVYVSSISKSSPFNRFTYPVHPIHQVSILLTVRSE